MIRSGARDLCTTFAGARVFFFRHPVCPLQAFRANAETPGHGLRRRTRVCSSVRVFFFGAMYASACASWRIYYILPPRPQRTAQQERQSGSYPALGGTLPQSRACTGEETLRPVLLLRTVPVPCPYPLPAIVAGDSAGATASAGALRISRCWLHRWQKRRRCCRKIRRTRAVGEAVS